MFEPRKFVALTSYLICLLFVSTSFAGDHAANEVAARSRSSAPAKESKTEGDPDRVLMVLFSGFKSCDDTDFLADLKTDIIETVKQDQPSKKVDVIRFCFDSGYDTVRVIPPGAKDYLPGTSSLRDSLLSLNKLQEDYGNTIVIGHSWGGWSALKAIEGMKKPVLENPNSDDPEFPSKFADGMRSGWADGNKDAEKNRAQKQDPRSEKQKEADSALWAGDANGGYWTGYKNGYEDTKEHQALPVVPPLKTTLLVTIDPISGEFITGCNPGTILRGSERCKEFPRDIDQKQVAASVGGSWLNFYQDTQEKVHSGPTIHSANGVLSQKINGNHTSLKRDPRLTKEIVEAVRSSLVSSDP